MRFSSVFESTPPMRIAQAPDRAEESFAVSTPATPNPAPAETLDDLEQRVRQIGEWQLEDW